MTEAIGGVACFVSSAGVLKSGEAQARIPARRSARMALTLAISAAGLLVSGAPAMGADVPEASDFSQSLAGAERSGGPNVANGMKRSGVLTAPQRFDLAGLAGERREAELRGRVRGGEWTEWTPAANGDPVWFGGMDELQVRAHDWVPSGTVHYVNVTDPGPAATVSARGKRGDDDRPKIVSRGRWGANKGCVPRSGPKFGKVKAASIHHTVSAVDYSQAEARGMVLSICRFHRNGNGWNDIGYQALVDRFGNIYEGRDGGLRRALVGAHAEGVNAQTTGVAVLGTHSSVAITPKAMAALARWLAWKLPVHGHEAKGTTRLVSAGGGTARYPAGTGFRAVRIIGHRVTNYTECPGDALYAQLPKLRTKTQSRINRGGSGGGSGGTGGGGIGL